MNPLEQLLDSVKKEVKDPDRLALAVRVTADYALLQSQAASGAISQAQLDHELGIVAAIARNLDDVTRQKISNAAINWGFAILSKALGVPVAG